VERHRQRETPPRVVLALESEEEPQVLEHQLARRQVVHRHAVGRRAVVQAPVHPAAEADVAEAHALPVLRVVCMCGLFAGGVGMVVGLLDGWMDALPRRSRR